MATRWRIAILLAIITTINYIDRSVFGVVAPVVRDQFGIGDADYGLITSGFLLAYGIGQLISGPLIDRLGTKRAFSLAAVFWSVATILHALGRGLWSFLALRVLLGLAEAANFPAASKAVAQWFPANERSTAVAIFMLGAGLGAIITPPLTVWTMQTLGWQWAFIVPGSLGLIWVFLWQRWYYLPETHPTIEPTEKALILEQRSNQQSQGSWMVLLNYREFWGILIARVVSDFPFYFFLFWLPQYLIDVRGFDLRAIAMFAWLPWVAADLGALTGGSLSSALVTRGHTINRARKTVIWLGAVLVALAVIPAYYTASSALALALICFGLFAIQVKGSVFFTLPTDLFPADRVATVWGVFGAVGSLGGSLLGLLAGYLIQEAGYESVFLMIASLHLISALLLQVFVPKIDVVVR
ncbi:MAG: MFS transporter [Halieaceae bacterium]|jgi:ACS family hexuronate transporter-like MFS transporter|nr:MFS transporter [Halieaceae bacterium]